MDTNYEVVNQRTGEITSVEEMVERDGFIDVTTATQSGIIGLRFRRISETEVENAGDYFSLREKVTQVTLDDKAVIGDTGVEVPVKPEVVAEIEQGKVNPDEVVEKATEDMEQQMGSVNTGVQQNLGQIGIDVGLEGGDQNATFQG